MRDFEDMRDAFEADPESFILRNQPQDVPDVPDGNVVVVQTHRTTRWYPQYTHPADPTKPLILDQGSHWHMPIVEAIGTGLPHPSVGRAHPDHAGRDFAVVPDPRTVLKTQAHLDLAIQNVREGRHPLAHVDGFDAEGEPLPPAAEPAKRTSKQETPSEQPAPVTEEG